MSGTRHLLAPAAVAMLMAAVPTAANAAPPANAAQSKKTTITLSGSTSVAPLARELIKEYRRQTKNRANFRLLQGASDVGVNDAARGRVSIGMASRDPLRSDPGGLTFTPIAKDGVCIITNRDNPLGNLSQEQVRAIFQGRVRSWSDVPGARSTGAITLIQRTAASGTGDAFRGIFLGPNANVAASAQAKSSNGLVNQAVRSDRNAIGFVDFNFIQGVSTASYEGVACTLRNAKAGTYRGVRNFHFVTRGRPKGESSRWIRWIRSDSRARRIINKNWIALR